MKKIIVILVGCLLAAALFGCSSAGNDGTGASSSSGSGGSTTNDIPEWADTDEATQSAQDVIGHINAREFNEVAAMFEDGSLTGDQLAKSLESYLDDFGDFTSFGEAKCIGGEEGGVEFVTVFQVTNYENQSITYRVSFAEDGTLAGLYI